MKSNINTVDNKLCTGCGVCSVICPKSCIQMKKSNEGFYLPDIDEKTCIDCGLCQKVCYKYYKNFSGIDIKNSKGYLAFSKDKDIRKEASSGGIGKQLTIDAINNNFEVCGVEYNYNKENAQHIIINNLEGLNRIVGSKYIPSYTYEAFKKLDKDKKYMIIGTPCQIYGLRKLQELNKLNKDLILVDFFCHGTPSLNLWDKYLTMVKDKLRINKIEKINFRDKKSGWHNFSMSICSDKKTYTANMQEDVFLQFFLSDVDLNFPCYGCKFRFNKIYSDIRLADFWGRKCKNDELGTSLVLANTNVGEAILKKLNNVYLEEVSFQDIKDSQYCKSINIPNERAIVQKELAGINSIESIYAKYLIPIRRYKKRKEIITYPLRKIKGLIRRCKRCVIKV